jgi:hypothetical protein
MVILKGGEFICAFVVAAVLAAVVHSVVPVARLVAAVAPGHLVRGPLVSELGSNALPQTVHQRWPGVLMWAMHAL